MFSTNCVSEIEMVRKKGCEGHNRPVVHLGEQVGENVSSNLPQLANTTLMVVICWVSNGKHFILSPKQLQTSYTDESNCEGLVEFIHKNGYPNAPYILKSISKYPLERDKLDDEHMELRTHGHILNALIYGQISYNYCCEDAFKLNLGHNVQNFVVEMIRATAKEIAKHIIWPGKVIPVSLIKTSHAQQQFILQTLEGSEAGGWEKVEEYGGQENDTCIDISSD